MSEELEQQERVYQGLRRMALGVRPEQLGAELGPDEPYVVLMEMGVEGAVVSVVAVIDGTASIYFSTGGGRIGGIGHETIRSAAVDMVDESARFISQMHPVDEFPLPGVGMVVFYVVTPSTVYAVVDEEEALGLGQSALTALFFAGQRIITEYRRIPPQ